MSIIAVPPASNIRPNVIVLTELDALACRVCVSAEIPPAGCDMNVLMSTPREYDEYTGEPAGESDGAAGCAPFQNPRYRSKFDVDARPVSESIVRFLNVAEKVVDMLDSSR
ncbi:MAG: hypothetical protein B6D36_13140 [Planctomycetes bacterium UTPLA1]|nr:MAG: hypothetical protein B6D36_13140 [Planctomycetes bacterium UTPLA1]